jgi:hypothetical protein
MDEHELFAKLTKVEAPAGFEVRVLARLPAARAGRARARRRLFAGYALAGSAALLLFAVLVLAPGGGVPADEPGGLTFAEREALSATPVNGGRSAAGTRLVPVYETMDYASEYRNARPQPRTVYILEQVSETVSSGIIY